MYIKNYLVYKNIANLHLGLLFSLVEHVPPFLQYWTHASTGLAIGLHCTGRVYLKREERFVVVQRRHKPETTGLV